MIDLNEIEIAARKPWYCRSKQEDNLLRPDALIELITLLREAERDAARYRWLRERASLESHGGFEYDLPLIHAIRCMDGSELNQEMTFDEAIDQAMKEKGDE